MIPHNVRLEANHASSPSLPSSYTWTGIQSVPSSHVAHVRKLGHRLVAPSHSSSPNNHPTPQTTPKANAREFTRTSTILVDTQHTPFRLHTSLLTLQSSYFRAALHGPFIESTNNTITLDDVPIEHFQLIVAWLYTSAIPKPFKDGKPAYYTLLHTYALADRLGLEGARNAIADAISELADCTNSVLTPADTCILYEEIRESAPLWRLALDLFGFKKTDRLLESHEDSWHESFLRDLSVLLKRPCEQALLRHRLRVWCPQSWQTTRACDYCRLVLPPRHGAVVCEDCCVAFCNTCVEGGVAMAAWDEGRRRFEGSPEDSQSQGRGGQGSSPKEEKTARKTKKWEACKPWRGARCLLYHEHDETQTCVDRSLG